MSTLPGATSLGRGAGFQPATNVRRSLPIDNPRIRTSARRPTHPGVRTAYLVTTKTRDSRRVFEGAIAQAAVDELQSLRDRYGFLLLAYVFMSNHAHFVIVPAGGFTISQTVRAIKGPIARRVNALMKSSGSVWQEGFRDDYAVTTAQLNRMIRYVEENPVKAGLCRTPESFPYSSANRRSERDYDALFGVSETRAESPRRTVRPSPSTIEREAPR